MSSSSSSGLIVLIVLLVVLLLYTVLNIVAVVKIITKAGYSGAWFLILFVPIVGTIMFYVFAFSSGPSLNASRLFNAQASYRRGLVGHTLGPVGSTVGPRARKVRLLPRGGPLRSPLVPTSLRGTKGRPPSGCAHRDGSALYDSPEKEAGP